jgi:hypothetical protein
LADASWRGVTTPNTDTVYSRAYLDLSGGPINITMPDMDGRYYSLALLDMATNNFYIGGRRTTGTLRTTWVIVGPDWAGPMPIDVRIVRAPGNDVLALMRTLVDGPEDMPAVHTLQDQFTCAPLNGTKAARWGAVPPNGTTAEEWVTMANVMLERNPPPSYEAPLLAKLRRYGICGKKCTWTKLSPQIQAQWNARLPDVIAAMRSGSRGSAVNGWRFSGPLIGNFGTGYYTRAQTAVSGLLALPIEDAIYPQMRADEAGNPITGADRFRLALPAGVPQVNAFWSLTLYEVTADGSQYFVDNEINRYAIGDRTPGLHTNADGSIDLWIQNAAPADETQRANWLPAPTGPFSLVFRAYEPGADFRDRRKPLPALEKL